MTPFERHGIAHLSASSLNSYAMQPALWVMERLLKHAAPVGAAAHRGSAIEAGVAYGLINMSKQVRECQATAMDTYDKLTALSGDPNRAKEREAVAPTVETALTELCRYGTPDQYQAKIEKYLDDVPVPLTGYLDFGWTEHGIILDLKTELRLSSEIKNAHARQVAVYIHNTNYEGRVCYATPKKLAVYKLENPKEHIEALRQIALRLQRFLAISNDPHELAALVVPDVDHWLWNNPLAAASRREVYGM